MSWCVQNVVSGELLDIETPPGMTREARRHALRDYCSMMNRVHVAGSEHVREWHDGEAQRYRLVQVSDD